MSAHQTCVGLRILHVNLVSGRPVLPRCYTTAFSRNGSIRSPPRTSVMQSKITTCNSVQEKSSHESEVATKQPSIGDPLEECPGRPGNSKACQCSGLQPMDQEHIAWNTAKASQQQPAVRRYEVQHYEVEGSYESCGIHRHDDHHVLAHLMQTEIPLTQSFALEDHLPWPFNDEDAAQDIPRAARIAGTGVCYVVDVSTCYCQAASSQSMDITDVHVIPNRHSILDETLSDVEE